jgi:glycogen phosphorylase
VAVELGEISTEDVLVQLYADTDGGAPFRPGDAIDGGTNGYAYTGWAPATRPAEDYTVRIIPSHPGRRSLTELP